MSGKFSGSAVIVRPIAEVFDFLAAGTNDPAFSPRVLSITKEPDGPTRVGTVFASLTKDAGVKADRRFEIIALEAPTTVRWAERSKNIVTAEGGYDLEDLGGTQTRVTIFNTLKGHGFGKLIVGFALKEARKDADPLAERIKAAIEAS